MSTVRDLTSARELVQNLTLRELRGRYKRSVGGWAWSLANPIVTALVFSLVFGVVLKVEAPVGDPSGLDIFALFLLCGLMPWTFFANGVTAGMASLVENEALIKKVWFPRESLVASQVLAALITFAIEMSVLIVILTLAGSLAVLWTPAAIVIAAVQAVFILGAGLQLSVLNARYQDVKHLVAVALQLGFYMTPIVYPLSLVPEEKEWAGVEWPARTIYELNPMVGFVEAYRDVLYDNRLPSLFPFGWSVVVSFALLFIGARTFARRAPYLGEEL